MGATDRGQVRVRRADLIGARDLVSHPNFGVGLVMEMRNGGYEAKVNFSSCTIWVPASRLTLVKPHYAPSRLTPKLTYSLMQVPEQVDFRSKYVIESLRLGVVPDFGIEEWTVGRQAELNELRHWLGSGTEGSIIIEGRYGSGKTHMLRFLAHHAIENNFAVSFVRIDPGEENSSFPYRLYASALRNLRVPFQGAVADIQTVVMHHARAGQTVLDNHPFFGPFLEAFRSGKLADDEWLGFLGEKSSSRYFPSKLDYTTVANLVCNQLSALSRFLTDDARLSGLLLLLDEVETAEIHRYSYHWQRTLNFLRGLTMAANDDDALDEPVVRDRSGVRIGADTGLVYSGHYPDVKYYFRIPTMLKVVLALTDCRVNGQLRKWKSSQPLLELSYISSSDLMDLFSKVTGHYYALYKSCFSSSEEPKVLQLLRDAYYAGSIRGFIKGAIEMLDFRRHHPELNLDVLESTKNF